MSDTTRLSVNINAETAAFIRSRMASEGRSATEIVRRMTAVYKALTDAWDAGDRLVLEGEDGVKELRLL